MIAILGGTFDPIHNGHLYIAEQVLVAYDACDKVLFVPNREPVHRDPPIASPEERAEMVVLATEIIDGFKFCDIEVERPGPSYMIDTIKTLKKLYRDKELALILGNDAYADFTTWLHFEEILEYASLIVINRLNTPNAFDSDEKVDQSRVSSLDLEPYLVSSTDVRQAILHHEAIDEMIPYAVQTYITEHDLYSK